jgi:hypothetical protein
LANGYKYQEQNRVNYKGIGFEVAHQLAQKGI